MWYDEIKFLWVAYYSAEFKHWNLGNFDLLQFKSGSNKGCMNWLDISLVAESMEFLIYEIQVLRVLKIRQQISKFFMFASQMVRRRCTKGRHTALHRKEWIRPAESAQVMTAWLPIFLLRPIISPLICSSWGLHRMDLALALPQAVDLPERKKITVWQQQN